MAMNIKVLDVEGLLSLRAQIDTQLSAKCLELQKQLAQLDAHKGSNGKANGRGKGLKGRKVAPKYRSKKDPKLTWSGRGAMAGWMKEEMKAGKLKKDAFLIK